ncbi:isoamylase early set domain-containing protein [Treponema sp. OMZ 840]|uniref:isoamylase early set domain-containing protein n=1 Tax=Treponema sp. OMZ 840 TaxID=244313 RepID=UPI003D90B35D
MALKKTYTKTGKKCSVTFSLPAEAAHGAEKVWLCGDFNNWSTSETPLKKQKNGSFSVTLSLESGQEYQFRYLIDGKTWENDWAADKYLPAPFSATDNSVVCV